VNWEGTRCERCLNITGVTKTEPVISTRMITIIVLRCIPWRAHRRVSPTLFPNHETVWTTVSIVPAYCRASSLLLLPPNAKHDSGKCGDNVNIWAVLKCRGDYFCQQHVRRMVGTAVAVWLPPENNCATLSMLHPEVLIHRTKQHGNRSMCTELRDTASVRCTTHTDIKKKGTVMSVHRPHQHQYE